MSDKVYEYKEVRVVYGKDGNEVMFVGGGGGGGGGRGLYRCSIYSI